MSPVPRASWRNPRILAILLVVFLCGSFAGALVMRYAVHPQFQQPAVYWTKGGREITLEHYEEELNLTPEQSRQMELIIDDFMMYIHTLQAQMDEVRANGKSRILRILDPEQQARFEEMIKEVPSPEVH
jgi:Spy/CpxP family protein refolding chaperone